MRRLALVAVFALFLSGAAASSAMAGVRGSDRPFSGSVVGMAIFVPANPLGCPPPYSITTTAEAVGTMSHLGLVTMTSSHCPLADSTVADATMTLVAANGDKLFGTYTGGSGPPGADGYFFGHYTVTFAGGTGRFQHASGTAAITAKVLFLGFDVLDWPATWSFEGTLSY